MLGEVAYRRTLPGTVLLHPFVGETVQSENPSTTIPPRLRAWACCRGCLAERLNLGEERASGQKAHGFGQTGASTQLQ